MFYYVQKIVYLSNIISFNTNGNITFRKMKEMKEM